MEKLDILVIGGGQSGLALGYYLRRTSFSYKILDKERLPGGSWQHYWESLRLFSPAQWSSLPGIIMEGGPDYYPSREQTIQYLRKYELKYKLVVDRPVDVFSVEQLEEGAFRVNTSKGVYQCKALLCATGSLQNPNIPNYPGMSDFKGKVLHSAEYQNPEPFRGKKVVVVGEGNSGAQLLAELSKQAKTFWLCSKPPRFLPDEVNGRVLFDSASELYKAKQEGRTYTPPSLGDIVMVPSVKEARERNALHYYPPISAFRPDEVVLTDGQEIAADAVVFCTGFRPSLDFLKTLGILKEGKVKTSGTKASHMEGIWLVGYGSWTGFASATLIGVGRSARQTVKEVETYLSGLR